jgi:transcriptional regulator with XRE-family HTH domain
MKTLSDRVLNRRTELKMSQADLAKASGISQSTIAQIESGRNKGSKHLLALADALMVEARWLQHGGRAAMEELREAVVPHIPDDDLSRTMQELNAAVHGFPSRFSPTVAVLLRMLIESIEAGVPAVRLQAIQAMFEALLDAQKAKMPSDRSIESEAPASKSEQVSKGRAGVKAALPETENSDKSGHERRTGTER